MSNSSVDVGITPNGQNVIITIKLADSEGVSVNMPAVGVGSFVNGLLSAAVTCGETTGQLSRLKTMELDPPKLGHVLAHGAAVVEDKARPEILVLVFAIGATQLSIGVPKENLTQLGSLFLKLGDKAAGN
jgi:hypothetical protein